MTARALTVAVAALALAGGGRDRVVVQSSAELMAALARAMPGMTIALAPGTYEGNLRGADLAGTAEAPIVIEGADAAVPPVIRGGNEGLKLTRVRHITLRGLVFENQRQNGINIDDG